jgi:hypothetical protein
MSNCSTLSAQAVDTTAITLPAATPAVPGRGLRLGRSMSSGYALLTALLCGCGAAPASMFPDAASAIARLRAGVACNRAVQVEGKVDYFEGSRRVRGRVAILAALPEQVRIEAFSFGVNLSTLTSDGESFSLYDLQSRTFWLGPAKACNLARFTKVALPPFALVQLLRGEAPVLVHRPQDARISWHSSWFGGGQYLLEIRGNHESVETITLQLPEQDWTLPWQQQRLRMTDVTVVQAGRTLYEVMIGGYALAPMASAREDPDGLEPTIMPSGPQCAAELPRRLRFISSSGDTDFVLEYKNASHNPPLLPGVFRQPMPGGVRRLYAECSD